MEQNKVEGLSDPQLITQLEKKSRELLDENADLLMEWVTHHGWIVVPTESEVTLREAEWISNACQAYGYDECFAIITEPDPISFNCYRLSTSKMGILHASYQAESNHYLLMPADQGFAILRPFGLYSLVAGSNEFVEMAVGSTVETARKIFWDFANDSAWPERDRQFLTAVSNKWGR